MMARPIRPWIAVALGGLLMYAAAFGPACWALSRGLLGPPGYALVERAYRPIIAAAGRAPAPLARAIDRYAALGMPHDVLMFVAFMDEAPDGSAVFVPSLDLVAALGSAKGRSEVTPVAPSLSKF